MNSAVDEHHCRAPRFDAGNPIGEAKVRRAFWLTVVMMVVEIAGGWWYNSMAVLADGWHMSSHSLALGLSAFAYAFARKHAGNKRYAFGTWKIEVLGGYTSALFLFGIAGFMAFESVARLAQPQPIQYDAAIGIAVVGLAVNLLCAWLLRDQPHSHAHGSAQAHAGHDHDHDHVHGHDHEHVHHHEAQQGGSESRHADLNVQSAYMHVLADAATSVLAIVALLGGRFFGFQWLDPAMGIVGAVLVAVWAKSLLRDTGRVLLDAEMDAPVVAEIRAAIEQGDVPARLTDLHVWRVGRARYACVLTVSTPSDRDADYFRKALGVHEEIAHATIEVDRVAR